jgi:hypothetical protein
MRKMSTGLVLALLIAAAPALAQSAKPAAPAKPAAAAPATEDRYVGYYYPKPTSTETFTSSMQTIQGVDRAQRIQFVTVVSQGTLQSAYRVPYAVFAKGEKGDKLIIVGLQPGELSSVYKMRGVLANMTTMSRLSPFFQERTVAEDATFFDLLKLLGFQSITITDGEKLTHQVTIKYRAQRAFDRHGGRQRIHMRESPRRAHCARCCITSIRSARRGAHASGLRPCSATRRPMR